MKKNIETVIVKPEPTADDFNLAFIEYQREQDKLLHDKIELIIFSTMLAALGVIVYSVFNN